MTGVAVLWIAAGAGLTVAVLVIVFVAAYRLKARKVEISADVHRLISLRVTIQGDVTGAPGEGPWGNAEPLRADEPPCLGKAADRQEPL